MDNRLMIKKLKKVGIEFQKGLRDSEFDKIESTLEFRFPKEIRSFLSHTIPIGKDFYNWRDLSSSNIQKFHDFQKNIEQAFVFDIENNYQDLMELLQNKFPDIADKEEFEEKVFEYLHQSKKIIPFFARRCFFDGMDDMPIISFWQPTDSIFYGYNFEDYLINEFINTNNHSITFDKINPEIKDTGIWYDLLVY